MPWPLLRDGDRLPVLIDWPETGKARAPENWPQICIYIPVAGRCRGAPEREREEGTGPGERIEGGGSGPASGPPRRPCMTYHPFFLPRALARPGVRPAGMYAPTLAGRAAT